MKTKTINRPNAGFSLVELLVAITILLIVVVPILHSFVTAARTNAKSKKVMQATSTAQNIMEELKAYSLEKLKDTYTIIENPDSTYTIEMDNVSMGKGTFNARVTLDPTIYQKDPTETELKYNDFSRANIAYMDILKDAFYVQESTSGEEVAQEFLDLYKDAGGSLNYDTGHFLDAMSRKISINIGVMENFPGDSTTIVTITYTYTTSDTTISPDKRTIEKPQESKIYDNAEYDEELRGIYLFYNPLYGSKVSNVKDTIEINNESNLDINFYIVKQKTSDFSQTNENQYMVQLNVKEKPETTWTLNSDFKAKTHVRTNLGRDIEKTDQELANKQSKVTYIGNGTAVNDAKSRQVLDYNSLDAPSIENRLYGAVIEIYEIKGGGDKYDADKKLISIDGSKEE